MVIESATLESGVLPHYLIVNDIYSCLVYLRQKVQSSPSIRCQKVQSNPEIKC